MLKTINGEKLESQTIVKNPTEQTPPEKRKRNSSILLDSSDKVKIGKFCLEDEEEKTEYEIILNNPALQIFRDEFQYDRLGKAQIVIWYYDNS